MAQISPAKPSASSKKKKRSDTANTAPDDWFWKHGIIWSQCINRIDSMGLDMWAAYVASAPNRSFPRQQKATGFARG